MDSHQNIGKHAFELHDGQVKKSISFTDLIEKNPQLNILLVYVQNYLSLIPLHVLYFGI